MAENFDPYYTWLGIPPEDQPPDHYRLLGVRQFESNRDVISNLTDQRMAHVKTFQAGPHGALSQKLLNEIAAARVCLLNPEKRNAYDAKLREQIALETAPEALPLAEPEVVAPPPIAPPASTPQSDSVSDAFAFIAATAGPVAAGSNLAVHKAVQSRAKQRARARWLFIAAPILGIAMVVIAITIRNSQEPDDGDSTVAPKGASTALASGGQKSGPAHGLSSSGKPPATKPQTEAANGGATKESDRAAHGSAQGSSSAEPISRATDSASNPPSAPDASGVNPPSTEPASSGSDSAPNSSDSHPDQSTAGESWAARAKALTQSGSSAKTPEDRVELMRTALKLFSQAEGAGRWSPQALELIELAKTNGRNTSEGALLADWFRTAEARIRREKGMDDSAVAARDALGKEPDNPGANTILGEFLCFQMENWAEGLPHLAKGTDPALKKLAGAEKSPPSAPLEQLKLADSWWDAGSKRPGVALHTWSEGMRARAAYWYCQCAPGLTGSASATARKRIAEAEAAAAASASGAMAFNLEPYALRGHSGKVQFLTFSPDGSLLVSADNGDQRLEPAKDNTLRIWKLNPPQQFREFPINKGWFGPHGIAVSRDSRFVAVSAGWDWGSVTTQPTIEIFDILGGVKTQKFNLSGRWAMRAVAFSNDGASVYAARSGRKLHEWSLRSGSETSVVERTPANDGEMPYANEFMPDGARIVSADWSGIIRMWDRKTGEQIMEYRGHEKCPTALAVSTDGSRLLSAADDNSVRVLDTGSGKELLALTGLETLAKSVAIGPDKTWFATGENDGAVRIRDAATGKQRLALLGASAPMISLAISPNGKMIAAGGEDGSVLLWTISGGGTTKPAGIGAPAGNPSASAGAGSAPKPGRTTIIAARWGIGNKWVDVTGIVRDTVARGQTVYANRDFLKSDPAYGVQKQLQIIYMTGNKRNTATILGGAGQWTNSEYGR